MVNRLLARKLITGIELRHGVGIGNTASDGHRDLCFLNHAAIIPRVAKFVLGLVVVSRVVCAKLFFAPFFRVADVFVTFLQTD